MRRLSSDAGILAPKCAGGSFLIVDGSAATRHALAELLTESGYVVQTASGAREMMAVCRELTQPLDVVLLDFRLHDGRGDLAAAFARERWPEVTIIFSSCVRPDQDAALSAALLEPRTGLILKPTSLETILRVVKGEQGP